MLSRAGETVKHGEKQGRSMLLPLRPKKKGALFLPLIFIRLFVLQVHQDFALAAAAARGAKHA